MGSACAYAVCVCVCVVNSVKEVPISQWWQMVPYNKHLSSHPYSLSVKYDSLDAYSQVSGRSWACQTYIHTYIEYIEVYSILFCFSCCIMMYYVYYLHVGSSVTSSNITPHVLLFSSLKKIVCQELSEDWYYSHVSALSRLLHGDRARRRLA